MPPCHTTPFIKPGIAITIAPAHHTDADNTRAECCDYCGSERLEWRKCKLVCNDCRQINKSCADL
jgi:hypothetical protein